jgi:hypothetical protein
VEKTGNIYKIIAGKTEKRIYLEDLRGEKKTL